MGITTDPNDPGINKPGPDGQNLTYLVLSDEERAKSFIRPVRQSYIHLKCKTSTKMGLPIAETYARNPKFYGATFCVACGQHFSLKAADGTPAFVWEPDGTPVGE